MSEVSDGQDISDGRYPLNNLPKTALQAIYHAVTGKTENLSKTIEGNVMVAEQDFDRLYGMIIDQTNMYERVCDPTTTVVVKTGNDKTITYSSWERFKALRVNNHDITSEITLRVEFVIKLPDTVTPQRCTVDINLDSSLPVITSKEFSEREADSLGFFFVVRRNWHTVKISIDFVDFLVAKYFSNTVEEWFGTLKKCPDSGQSRFLLDNINTVRKILSQSGRIGMGVFLIFLIILHGENPIDIRYVTLGSAIGLLLWSFIFVAESSAMNRLTRRVNANIIPSIILLTGRDIEEFETIKLRRNNPWATIFNTCLAMALGISLNIAASYIYSYLTLSSG